MQQMHILCGFDNPTFEKAIIQYLAHKGIECKLIVKLTKLSIKEYIKSGQKCDAAILLETMPNGKFYAAEEIADLTDERDINIIVMVSARRYGTNYLQTLYAAGVTSAFLQKGGRQSGAKVKDIGELLLNRRSRKDARVYYGLEKKKMDLGFLDNESFIEYYENFKDETKSPLVMERFVSVCSRMTPEQIADFIRRLPEVDSDELKKYEEFYEILELLKKVGIKFKVKRPRKVSIGLTKVAPLIEEQAKVTPTEKSEEIGKDSLNVSDGSIDSGNDSDNADEALTMDMLMALLMGQEITKDGETGVESGTQAGDCSQESVASIVDSVESSESVVVESFKEDIETKVIAAESSLEKTVGTGIDSAQVVHDGLCEGEETSEDSNNLKSNHMAEKHEKVFSSNEDEDMFYEDCELFLNSSHQYIAPICVGVVVVISLILIILCCLGVIDFSILV